MAASFDFNENIFEFRDRVLIVVIHQEMQFCLYCTRRPAIVGVGGLFNALDFPFQCLPGVACDTAARGVHGAAVFVQAQFCSGRRGERKRTG